MASKAELACVYSALILVDDDVAVTVSRVCLVACVKWGYVFGVSIMMTSFANSLAIMRLLH